VIFLTDGLPTIGETNIERIADDTVKANTTGTRLFVFGVGYDVNAVLLDKLSSQNHGVSEYVRPKEDIEIKVSSFYSKVQNPVLTDVALDFGPLLVNDLFPRVLPDLFEGGQLVVVGRYREPMLINVMLKGKLQSEEKVLEYPLEFKPETDATANNFVARIWASKKIGFLIDEMRVHGRDQELVDEIVRLSKEFGIITEYTSFLVETDEEIAPAKAAGMARGRFSDSLGEGSGSHGVAQAENLKQMQEQNQVNVVNRYYDREGNVVEYDQVRNVGSKAFYNRNGFWVDATFDADKQQPVEVVQFYKEFFYLVGKLGRDNQYLSFADNVIVNLEGQTYKIVEAKGE
jgi:Ca-activated chloride channel family protein